MAELTVDLTYGTALYQAAAETGRQREILEEGCFLADLLKSEPELDMLLKSPAIAAEQKKTMLCDIFEGKLVQELVNFLCILIDKGRFTRFARIMRVYGRLYDNREGIIKGTIYSVEPLDSRRLEEFEKQTAKLMGGRVFLENRTDKSLIGGVKVLVNGKIIDASIRSRLDRIASEIRI